MNEFELIKDKNKRVAIIYSIDDLFAYVIKVCYQDDSFYIGNDNFPEKFGNIDQAKRACRKYNVDEAYLALSNSYQEVDATTDKPYDPMPRYDYQKIFL